MQDPIIAFGSSSFIAFYENSDSCFRFNNPKQCSNWIILGVILFVSFSYKQLLQCSFYENLKNRFFRKKFKKVCVLQRKHVQNFKCNYLENYNDSEHAVKTKNVPFFMNFPNINKNWATFPTRLQINKVKKFIYKP